MPSLSVPTEGAFGSSSGLAPRELAIHGPKKKRKKRKEDKERNAYAQGLAGGRGGGAWAQLELPDTLF